MNAFTSVKVFLRMLGMGRTYVIWYTCLSLLTVLLASIHVAIAEMFKRLANAATDQDMELLLSAVVLAIGILIIQLMGNLLNKYLTELLNTRSSLQMQSKSVKKILQVKLADLERYHSADIVNRIDDSVRQAQTGVNVTFQQVLGNVLQIVFLLSYLSFMNAWLTLGGLLIAAVLPLIINVCSKPMRHLYERRQQAIVEKEALIQDVIQGGEVVRSYSLMETMKNALAKKYEPYLKHHMKLKGYEVLLFRSHTFIWMIGVLYAFGFGGYLVSNNQLEVGEVVAFAIVFERFAFPLSALSGLWAQFQNAIAHGRRVFELLDLPDEHTRENVQSFTGLNDIHFIDVHFSYHSQAKALNGVTLTIPKGKTTSLIGPSGCGKSTIAKLLMTLYEPDSGVILNGNQRIQDYGLSDWRGVVAYIPQEPVIMKGTFFENIAFGREGSTRDEVIAAAETAQIHQMIMHTDLKYDSRIGDGGLQLSGGEKQRIAIARAFVQYPELVILDEPTSALDADHEALVIEEMKGLFDGKTILLISHRASTIQMADQVIYMGDGKVDGSKLREKGEIL